LSDLTQGNFTKNHLQAANATLNSVFTPSLVNSFMVGFQYLEQTSSTARPKFPLLPSPAAFRSVPARMFRNSLISHKFQFRDDITKTIQAHTFKFGADYVFDPNLGGFFESNATPEIDFNDVPSVITTDKGKYPQGFATSRYFQEHIRELRQSLLQAEPQATGPLWSGHLESHQAPDTGPRVAMDKDFGLVGADAMRNSRTFQELTADSIALSPALPGDDGKNFSPRIGFSPTTLPWNARHYPPLAATASTTATFSRHPAVSWFSRPTPTNLPARFFKTSAARTDIVPGYQHSLQNYHFGIDPLLRYRPASGNLSVGATGRLMDRTSNLVSQQFSLKCLYICWR